LFVEVRDVREPEAADEDEFEVVFDMMGSLSYNITGISLES
jgi:hypothetical protein